MSTESDPQEREEQYEDPDAEPTLTAPEDVRPDGRNVLEPDGRTPSQTEADDT